MEERRFDELTRVLGAATSRRQVLKGLLGGVLATVAARAAAPSFAAAAGSSCAGGPECERQAAQLSASCYNDCVQRLNGCMGGGGIASIPCFLTWHQCSATCEDNLRSDRRSCRESGCTADEQCCNGACVNVFSGDPNNCGACGHACPSGAECINSQCYCESDETVCNNMCVNLDDDPLNCGSCGNACGDCETCQDGVCQPIECASGQVCCQNECMPQCPNGFLPDPATCQCNLCLGENTDGNSCGENEICCGQQCVSNQCPSGMEYQLSSCSCKCIEVSCPGGHQDPQTCQCVCDPITCPAGESQDPTTCQCVDKCANVTCDECKTCDPESGTCVNAEAGTGCSSGVCCNGQCTDACPSGQHLDPGSCQCVDDCEPSPGGCAPGTVWDSATCQCVEYCGYMCEPNDEICCTDSDGYKYCCYSDQFCCNSNFGCCYPE